jgi:hypothetical protein
MWSETYIVAGGFWEVVSSFFCGCLRLQLVSFDQNLCHECDAWLRETQHVRPQFLGKSKFVGTGLKHQVRNSYENDVRLPMLTPYQTVVFVCGIRIRWFLISNIQTQQCVMCQFWKGILYWPWLIWYIRIVFTSYVTYVCTKYIVTQKDPVEFTTKT